MSKKVIIDEFVSYLSYAIDDKNLKKFVKGINVAAKAAVGMVAAVTGAVSGIAVTTALLNKETSKQVKLAEAVGLTVDTIKALEPAAKGIGLNFENIADLAEEINNRFGESKGLGAVNKGLEEGLTILNLKYKNLKDLKPEQQFEKIVDAALKLDDLQKSVSAVDLITGGEGNKLIGALRKKGVSSLKELQQAQQRLSLETDESRKGAVRYTEAWGKFLTLINSGKKLFAGVLGNELTHYLELMTDWVALNKDVVRSKIKSAVSGVSAVFTALLHVIKSANSLLSSLSNKFSVSKVMILGVIAALWLLAKHPVIFTISAIVLVLDDVISYMQGAESVTGGLIEKFNQLSGTTKVLTYLGGVLIALRAIGKVSRILRIIPILTSLFSGLMVVLRGVQFALLVMGFFFGLPVWAIAAIIAGVVALGAALYIWWDDVVRISKGVYAAITGSLGKIPAYLSAIGSKMGRTLSDWWSGVDILGSLNSLLMTVVNAFLRLHLNVINVMSDIVASLSNWWSGVNILGSLNALLMTVVNAFLRLHLNVINVMSDIVTGAITYFNTLKAAASSIISALVTIIVNTFSSIINSLQPVINTIVGIFTTFKGVVSSIISNLVAGIKSLFHSVGAVISSIFTTLVPQAARTMVSNVLGSMANVIDGVRDKINALWDWANNIIGKIGGNISGKIESVTRFFSSDSTGKAGSKKSGRRSNRLKPVRPSVTGNKSTHATVNNINNSKISIGVKHGVSLEQVKRTISNNNASSSRRSRNNGAKSTGFGR